MKFNTLNKIIFNKEYQLYELLKLKKTLETKYLDDFTKINNNSLKIKGFLLTKKVLFFLKNDTLNLIDSVNKYLNKNFYSFKHNGESIIIEGISPKNNKLNLPLFHRLYDFNLELEKFNAYLIVQGSYADDTYISYSDVDLVIIGELSKNIIEIKKRIEKYLIQIDPLQHHGVFFISRNTFLNYWQMELPISTLKKALVLSNTSVKINIPFFFVEKYSSFNWVNSFVNQNQTFPLKLNSGVFFTKYFISQLLLVPALLLATKGMYIYKRDSFLVAKKGYSVEAWHCIEIASSIREKWNQSKISTKYLIARENINIKKLKEVNTITDVTDINNDELVEFSEKFDLFINETKELLIKKKYDF